MDETLWFLLSEGKINDAGCQVLQQTVHANIFVRSQTAINSFENTCEHILNLSEVVGKIIINSHTVAPLCHNLRHLT